MDNFDHGATRVLVIDDYRDGAESLGILFESMGCCVRVALSGTEAINVSPRFCPQLVITDINMPGLNGYETTRRLKQQVWAGEAVFVAYTAVPEPPLGRLLPRDFDHYIKKPGAPSDFFAILRQVRGIDFTPAMPMAIRPVVPIDQLIAAEPSASWRLF